MVKTKARLLWPWITASKKQAVSNTFKRAPSGARFFRAMYSRWLIAPLNKTLTINFAEITDPHYKNS